MALSRAVHRPVYRPLYKAVYELISGGVSAASLLAEALVHLKDTGITVSGGTVTGWTNSGTGGSGYDLDTVEGTAADLVRRSVNGIDVVEFLGSANLVAGNDQLIEQPMTRITVVSSSDAAANNFIWGGESSSTSNQIQIVASLDSYETNATSTLRTANDSWQEYEPAIVVEVIDGASSKIQKNKDTAVTGDPGDRDFDYGTLGANRLATTRLTGMILESAMWNRALTDAELSLLQDYFIDRFTIPTKLADAVVWLKETGLQSTAVDGGSGSYITSWTNEGTGGSDYDIDTLVSTDQVTNGGFDADSDWTKGTGWTIGSGVASCDGSGGSLDQDSIVTAGVIYKLVWTMTGRTAGAVTPKVGGQAATERNADGTYTDYVTAGSTDAKLVMQSTGAGFNGSIDNVSLEPVWELSTLQGIACPKLPGNVAMTTTAQETISGDVTCFVVAQCDDLSADRGLMGRLGSSHKWELELETDKNWEFNPQGTGGGATNLNSAGTAEAPEVITTYKNSVTGGGGLQVNKNTLVTETGITGNMVWGTLGDTANSGQWVGPIVEVAIFNEILTDDQTTAIQNYLIKKHAIPLKIETAELWFNENGITGASPVTAWANSGTQSGEDLDTVGGTAASLTTRTINGVTAVDFGGDVDIEMSSLTSLTSPYTGICAFVWDTDTGLTQLWDGTTGSRPQLYIAGNDSITLQASSVLTGDDSVSTGQTYVVPFQIIDGTGDSVGVNLQTRTTGGAGDKTLSSFKVGGSDADGDRLDGAIAEIAITAQALTEEELTSWLDYAIRKLDITL